MVATVRVGEEGFAAVGGPLDRTLDALARPHQRRLLVVEEDLRAEAAADVGRDDAHPVLGDAEHERAHQQALDVRVLVRDVQRVALVGRVVRRVARTRLDRVRDQAVVAERQLADVRRVAERGIDRRLVAAAPHVADVVGRDAVDRFAARVLRRRRVDDRLQLVVRDVDHRRRVARLVERLGDDHRDRIADVERLAVREHRMLRLLHRRAVEVVDQPAARQPADLAEVGPGVDPAVARRL